MWGLAGGNLENPRERDHQFNGGNVTNIFWMSPSSSCENSPGALIAVFQSRHLERGPCTGCWKSALAEGTSVITSGLKTSARVFYRNFYFFTVFEVKRDGRKRRDALKIFDGVADSHRTARKLER